MDVQFRRLRKVVAVLASLAVATTISVVAPATASAQQARGAKSPTGVVLTQDKPVKGGVVANDWTW